MKKLLYIGHSYHNKTKSTQFLQELFASKYEVTKFSFDPYNDTFDKFKELEEKTFDVVVLFQIMPSLNKLKEIIKFDNIAFFPMYDGVSHKNSPIWHEYKDCNIINFSKTLHEKCKKKGLSSYYIQYFPEPKKIENMGDEKSVFFWQRINKITPYTVDKVIGIENINKFYFHQAIDPQHEITPTPKEWDEKVEISTWFDTKEEMETQLQKSAIYFAPRQLEGIGMSFLDAMAVGRCVIAPDLPTMNEYIVNGKNGYLYNLKKPKKLKLNQVRKIQENTIDFIKNGYENWNKEKYKILNWLETPVEENVNIKKMETNLYICEHVKKKINLSFSLFVKKTTEKYKLYYLFGFLPIYKKRRSH